MASNDHGSAKSHFNILHYMEEIAEEHNAFLNNHYTRNLEISPTDLEKLHEIFCEEIINKFRDERNTNSKIKVFTELDARLESDYLEVNDKLMRRLKSRIKKIDSLVNSFKDSYEEEIENYIEKYKSQLFQSRLDKYHFEVKMHNKQTLKNEISRICNSEPTDEHIMALETSIQKAYKRFIQEYQSALLCDNENEDEQSSGEQCKDEKSKDKQSETINTNTEKTLESRDVSNKSSLPGEETSESFRKSPEIAMTFSNAATKPNRLPGLVQMRSVRSSKSKFLPCRPEPDKPAIGGTKKSHAYTEILEDREKQLETQNRKTGKAFQPAVSRSTRSLIGECKPPPTLTQRDSTASTRPMSLEEGTVEKIGGLMRKNWTRNNKTRDKCIPKTSESELPEEVSQDHNTIHPELSEGLVRMNWTPKVLSDDKRPLKTSVDSSGPISNKSPAKSYVFANVVRSNGGEFMKCDHNMADNCVELSTTPVKSEKTSMTGNPNTLQKISTINSASRQSKCLQNPGLVKINWIPNSFNQPDNASGLINNKSQTKESANANIVQNNGGDSKIYDRNAAGKCVEPSRTSGDSEETLVEGNLNSSQTKSRTIKNVSRQSECLQNPEPNMSMQDMNIPNPNSSIVFHISCKYIGVALEDGTNITSMFYPAVLTLKTNDDWVLGEVDKRSTKHKWEFSKLWDLSFPSLWKNKTLYWKGHQLTLRMEFLISVALSLVRNEYLSRLRNNSETVIAVPFWFTSLHRQQILDAAWIAGFRITKIINENTSSAYFMYASQAIPSTDKLVVVSENYEVIDIAVYKFGKSNDLSMIASSEPIFSQDSLPEAKQSCPLTNVASEIDLFTKLEKAWKVMNIDQLKDSSNVIPFLISYETESQLKVIKKFADSVCISKFFCTGKETALLGLLNNTNKKEHLRACGLMLDDGTSYSLSITSKLDKSFARAVLRRSSCERNMSCKLLNKINTYYVHQVRQDISLMVGEIRMLRPLYKSCQYIATFSYLENGILKLEKIEEENPADKHNKLVELGSSKYIWKPVKLSNAQALKYFQFLKEIEEKQSIPNQSFTAPQASLFVQPTENFEMGFRIGTNLTHTMKKNITEDLKDVVKKTNIIP